MYGSMKPISIKHANNTRVDYDTISYVRPPTNTAENLLFSHRQNIAAVSTALWRMIPQANVAQVITRVQPYDLPFDNRLYAVYMHRLFPGIDDSKRGQQIVQWWLKNVSRTKIDYDGAIGSLSRRFGLMVPVVADVSVTVELLRLMIKFSIMLGYEDTPNLDTSFAFHVPYDLIEGTSLREKANTIVTAIPKRHLRRRISVMGADLRSLTKLANAIHTKVTVDHDKVAKITKSHRIDTEEYRAARTPLPGCTGRGMLFTKETNTRRLSKLLKHFDAHWYSTIIIDA